MREIIIACLLGCSTLLGCSSDPQNIKSDPDGAIPTTDTIDTTADGAAVTTDAAPSVHHRSSPFGFHPASTNNYEYALDLNISWSREGTYLRWIWSDKNRDGHLSFIRATAPPKDGIRVQEEQ